ncbi:MAG: Gldg family protein [Kofleriaceae bacterium]|nr:Gldg family protein [Kofleriaceae bacterium]MBP6837312.1 Gldg family protein [Kofleriaceae bacterium]MBP9204304.1 Gldg family protein [Kofleriaceae bacterium]
MRTASPWWASLIYVIGLFLLFLGQRSFHGVDGIGSLATLVGALLVVGITAARVWTTLGSRGGRRRVERTLLLAHVGAGAALLLYALTTKAGLGLVGVTEAKSVARWVGSMNVLWIILLVASLIPIAMVEFTLGTASRTAFDVQTETGDDGAVEYRRVRDIAWSGLTVALAMAFLMVTCQVSNERNVRRDVSYFKTSAPGASTIAIAKSSTEKFKVLLFFPQGNEVKVEVEGYFEGLAKSTGKVEVEAHDRMVSAKLAGDYKVTKDGTVVIVRGDKSELLDLETDWEKARRGKSKLRTLDREVNSRLLKLVREKRKAYLTVGHGEINDYESVDPSLKGRVPERRTTALKRRLGELNYEIKDLGLIDLAQGVPDDATMVMVLAPTQPLANEELAALDRYLGKGGRLLVALDPQGQAGLGPLEGRLGLTFQRGSLTDDKVYLRQRGNASDRRWAVTTQFSAHASTTTLSRAVDKGLLLIDAGALREVPFTVDADKSKKTMVIRSMASSWLDLEGGADFTFDEGSEKRDRYNIGAAVEGPKVPGEPDKDGKPTEKDGWRAMVFADGDLFADLAISEFGPSGPVTVIMVSGPLLDDASKWLGGEEIFVGEVTSEEDVAIKHTKNKDSAWFLMMVVGAPLLVLGIGLGYTWLRRRTRGKPSRTSEVTP